MPTAMPLRNVVGNRNCRSPHLAPQRILFFDRQHSYQLIGTLAKCPGNFVKLKVIQPKSPVIHTTHPLTHSPIHPFTKTPLTTHHSPLTKLGVTSRARLRSA